MTESEISAAANDSKDHDHRGMIPLPHDAPLLSFKDVAAYLRTTPQAVRRLIDGRTDGTEDEIGTILRQWVVRLSPHRRYIRRDQFLTWLKGKL